MNINAFIITSLAGLATLIGYLILWLKKKESIIAKTLGFSAGIMFSISIIDLLPNSFSYFSSLYLPIFDILFCFFFFLLGFLIAIFVNDKVNNKLNYKNTLYQVGILSLIAIIIHNIPEGIITYLTSTMEYKSGVLLAVSIACHNIPEGICITIPIYYSTKNYFKTFIFVLLSALSEPLGAIIAYLFFAQNFSTMILAVLLALIAGIMIALSFTEIIPEAKKYSFKDTIIYFNIGIIISFLLHLLF